MSQVTNGLYKSEAKSFEKVGVTYSVEETEVRTTHKQNGTELAYPVGEIDPRVICVLPVTPKFEHELEKIKMSKEFDCEYPSIEPNVNRVTYPLPFPSELEEVIGWADAFVDRVASLTAARKQQTQKDKGRLADEIERLEAVLTKTKNALNESRRETELAKEETQRTSVELVEANTKIETQRDSIARLESDGAKAAATEKFLYEKIDKLTLDVETGSTAIKVLFEKLQKADKKAADEHQKWIQEHGHHEADHMALKEAGKRIESERKAKQAAIDAAAVLRRELDQAKVTIQSKENSNKDLTQKLANLHVKLHEATDNNRKLRDEVERLKKSLRKAEHDLEAAKKKITDSGVEATKAKARISELTKDLEKAQAELDGLKAKITNLETEKTTQSQKIEALQRELDAAGVSAKDLTDKLEKAKTETLDAQSQLTEAIAEAAKEKEHLETDLTSTRKQLTHAWEDMDNLKKGGKITKERLQQLEAAEARAKVLEPLEKKVEELEAKVQALGTSSTELETKSKDLESKSKDLETKAKDFETKAKDLETKLATAEKSVIPLPAGKRINILSFEYGGHSYTDGSHANIMKKLYTHAEKGTKFTIDNDFVVTDPLPHHFKTFSITYQLEGENVVHHLYGKEHESKSFCLPKSN